MRILAVGGGSGGHVTPALAVINHLSKEDKNLEAYFICDHSFGPQAEMLMSKASTPVTVRRVYAGKFRRYHGISWVRQLLDIPTVLHNIKDIFLIAVGIIQVGYYVLRWRPDVMFTKGGFVCLPAGIIAFLFRIPMVSHDSDMRPGLTNLIISRWATAIATGMPLENYPYDKEKSHYVGVPIDDEFHPFSKKEQLTAKGRLGFVDADRPLVVVTGGGLGARRINDAISVVATELTKQANILHVTGKGDFDRVSKKAPEIHGYNLVPFVHDGMAKVLGAADIVVTRASATTLLELAGLAKPTIAIPAAVLGDQVKNAEAYASAKAVIAVDETHIKADPDLLLSMLRKLITNERKRAELSKQIHTFAKPHAARDTAQLILDAAKQ